MHTTSRHVKTVLASLALVFSLTPIAAYGEDLSVTEQRLLAAVKERREAALALLERSVRINSGTMNHEGVRAVGALFGAEFEQLGFQTKWVDMPAQVNRAGHLVAERVGQQGKRVLLIGHLDTVFEKDSPVQAWQRRGDKVFGQGVEDMKGGDVIIIEALRALHSIGALEDTQIQVVFTGDEEMVGSPVALARADLMNAAKRSDVALAFEATVRDKQGHATGTIGRRGSGGYTLEVQGKQGHSAGVFGKDGFGAIYEVARIVNRFREELIEPDLTFNAGVLLGGTEVNWNAAENSGTAYGKNNIIPPTALVKSDMRYLSAEQRDRTREKMRAIVANNLPGTRATIKFSESYPAMTPTAGNMRLLELYSQASQAAGLGAIPALPAGLRGAGDIQFVAPFVDSLDGLGASGSGSHSPDESMEIASIEKATLRTALLLYRLTRK